MGNFDNDFDFFWSKIENNENFAFARYADGEVMLMIGQEVGGNTQAARTDKWTAPNHLTRVGKDLQKTLQHTEDNYYYAISGSNDNYNDYNFLRSNITQKSDNITFVNLWINANYKRTLAKYNSLKRDVILICNEKAKKESFPFNVVAILPFPNNCIDFWETSADYYMWDLSKRFQDEKDTLVLVSCGPVSEIIISELYTLNPNNTYIDVGSSIDEYIHGYKTRPYMDPSSHYSKVISIF
jgi:hypothetical protein